ncbi:MAG: hypothetical protein ACTSVR_04790 [Candidatus Thorarchaeota archaeon]
MDEIEPLGKYKSEYSYQCTVEGDTGNIINNPDTGYTSCITCQRRACKHTALFEQYLETNELSFNWMREIAYTLTYHSRTQYRILWMKITNNNIHKGARNDKKKLIRIINNKLKSMSFYEVGYLTLMGLPVELDEDFLEPVWKNAKEWVIESGALSVYIQSDEFVCNDVQNEMLRKNMESALQPQVV